MSVLDPYLSVATQLVKTGEMPKSGPPKDLTSPDPRLNLDRIQRYLQNLPADYADFDMRSFVKNADLDDLAVYVKQNGSVRSCGTAACAVGHGPAAHMFMNADEIELIAEGDDAGAFWRYGERVFGTRINSPAFEWMFGGGWRHVDNSVHGAAKRIRYYLANGVPDGFTYAFEGSNYKELYADA